MSDEAKKYNAIRKQVENDLPEFIERHFRRKNYR